MPLTDYFNPNAMNPQTGFQPQGPMGGFHWAQNQQRYADMMGLQRMLVELEERKRREELERGFGAREAQRGQQEAQALRDRDLARAQQRDPQWAQGQINQTVGQGMSTLAAGQTARDTQASTAGLQNANNQFNTLATKLQELRVIASQHPPSAHAGYQDWLRQLPPQLQAQMPRVYSPDAVEAAFKTLSDTVDQRQKMAQIGAQTASAERIGAGHDKASMYGADRRLEAAWARMPAGTQKKVEGIVQQYLEMIMDGKTPTDAQNRAFMAAQQVMMNVRQAAGMPMDANIINWQMMNPGVPPPARPSPQPVPPPLAQPGPTPPPVQQASPVTQQQVQAAGWQYEPDKYEYRMGPNGKLQRKPK